MSPKIQLTCVPAGNSGVGKTAFMYRHMHRLFPSTEHDLSMFSMFYNPVTIDLRLDSRDIEMHFLDTIGTTDYDRARLVCHERANVFLLFFSIVDRESFDCIKTKWINEILESCQPGTPIILVGSKLDLVGNQNVLCKTNSRSLDPVSFNEGCQMAIAIGAQCYMQCSAKDNIGINNIIETACRSVVGYPATETIKCVIL